MRAGRKVKTHTASYDPSVKIPGLSRGTDGRWRVFVNGKEKRFTESNERRAVERAKTILGLDHISVTTVETTMGEILGKDCPSDLDTINETAADILTKVFDSAEMMESESDTLESHPFRYQIPDAVFYPWLRKMLVDAPEILARKTGIPELAALRHMDIPRDTVRLNQIIEWYEQENRSERDPKAAAIGAVKKLMAFTDARTLSDLTKEKIYQYFQHC